MDDRSSISTDISLREHASVLWRRRWYVITPLVAVVLGAIALTLTITPVYRADAKLQVNAAAMRPQDMDPFSGFFVSREAVASLLELVTTPGILEQAASNLDLASKGENVGTVDAYQVGKSDFFGVSVEHRDPALAQDIANEIAIVLKEQSDTEWQLRVATSQMLQEIRLTQLEQDMQLARQSLAAGVGDPDFLALQLRQYESQYATVVRSLEETRLGAGNITDVLVVRALAALPRSPVQPKPIFNLVFGIGLGLVLGLGLAYFMEYLDNRVKSPEQVTRLLGIPVMGALPLFSKKKSKEVVLDTGDPESDPDLEPYFLLRTNLRFSKTEPASRAILVTSSEVGEGKTQVDPIIRTAVRLK